LIRAQEQKYVLRQNTIERCFLCTEDKENYYNKSYQTYMTGVLPNFSKKIVLHYEEI